MMRLSEEQMAVIACYDNMDREKAITQMREGLPVIEDQELKEIVGGLISILIKCSEEEYHQVLAKAVASVENIYEEEEQLVN